MEIVFSFVATGDVKDKLNTMLVNKEWFKISKKVFYSCKSLIYSLEMKNLEHVKELLKDKRINPSEYSNTAIKLACTNNQIDIVRLLLTDKRVSPCDNNNECIILTCWFGYIEIVRELLKDPRVNPTTYNYSPLRNACVMKDTPIAIELLNCEKISQVYNEIGFILPQAVIGGSLEIVKEFLKNPKIIINDFYYKKAFLCACSKRRIDIVKELIEYNILNELVSLKECLNLASIYDNYKTVELLLNDKMSIHESF